MRIWYAAYGSNAHAARLACYLAGGRPEGAGREYAGCRDARPPERTAAVELPGAVYFATHSPVWGGGRAFYDPRGSGTAWAVAHLITAGQFADLAAQEMYAAPGGDLDLSAALATGHQVLGPGRYETVVCPGRLDGHPLLTLTAPWGMADVVATAPSAPYLRHLVAGLLEAGPWDPAAVAGYLARRPGAAGRWTRDELRAMAEDMAGDTAGDRGEHGRGHGGNTGGDTAGDTAGGGGEAAGGEAGPRARAAGCPVSRPAGRRGRSPDIRRVRPPGSR